MIAGMGTRQAGQKKRNAGQGRRQIELRKRQTEMFAWEAGLAQGRRPALGRRLSQSLY
jgi:hypothetical protein